MVVKKKSDGGEQFGSRLTKWRNERGLSQQELAARFREARPLKEGETRPAAKTRAHGQIGDYENGRRTPGIDAVELLASILNCDPGELAFGRRSGAYDPQAAADLDRIADEIRAVRDRLAQSALPTTGGASSIPLAGPLEAPAATGDAPPVTTTEKSRIIRRPAEDDDEALPDVRFTPRIFTAEALQPLRHGKVAEIVGLAAGKARYFELVETGDYHENGVKYLIAQVSGRSMETKIPNRSKVVLEVFGRPLEFRSGDAPPESDVRDGHVYMIELDDGLVTLKRLYLLDGASVLAGYNRREFGRNGLQSIPPGQPFRVLAKWEGFYEG